MRLALEVNAATVSANAETIRESAGEGLRESGARTIKRQTKVSAGGSRGAANIRASYTPTTTQDGEE